MTPQDKVKALRHVKSLLSEEENWIKGDIAEDGNKNAVSATDETAKCFCLMGASQRSMFDLFDKTHPADIMLFSGYVDDEMFQTITELYPPNEVTCFDWIDEFNDRFETEFKDIHKVIDATIERLEGQG